MSYSGQSNPPWQRNNLANTTQATAGLQNQMGIPNQSLQFQNLSLFGQSINAGHQSSQTNVGYSNYSASSSQILQAPHSTSFSSISYPQQGSRILNPTAFVSRSSNQPSSGSTHSQRQSSNYNSIGTVTKIHSDCGFVDDEVFFHKSVFKGSLPKVGDRVFVEAAFNSNSPFKWNASCIQIVSPTSNVGGGCNNGNMERNKPPPLMGTNISLNLKGNSGSCSGYNAVSPPHEYGGLLYGQRITTLLPPRRSPERHRGRRNSRNKDDDDTERKKKERERERTRERDGREREERRERERSPIKRSSSKRIRTRTIPRYVVQIPKISLTIQEADILELRRRYTNLYIPSDFFHTKIKWPEVFTPDKPFSIDRPCSFHIMHKSVDLPRNFVPPTDPCDANYLFSAKVMLMGIPHITELYEKCLSVDNRNRDDVRSSYIHPSRLINFLIGVRGKNEIMAIGGPWSPSLDGEDPKNDPLVLIRTAIRTCMALTGIDLSSCTQWYRFVELYYRRLETVHKGQVIPARVETVVIFLPDINSCVPTHVEWDNLHRVYKQELERTLNSEPSHQDDNSDNNSAKLSTDNDRQEVCAVQSNMNKGVNSNGRNENHDQDEKEPDNPSKFDPKTMTVRKLKDELEVRKLSSKGLKPQLIARLVKALNVERAEDAEKDVDINKMSTEEEENEDTQQSADNDQIGDDNIESIDMNDMVILDEYDATKTRDISLMKKDSLNILNEKERRQLERRFQLPENPHVIVHPSRTAKSGKFDCIAMSLSVLLDYRSEDTKERSFEVSLFAEFFNEMIMRDFGFNIYKEIALIPDKNDKEDTSLGATMNKEENHGTENTENENKYAESDKAYEENHDNKPSRGRNENDFKSDSSTTIGKKLSKDHYRKRHRGIKRSYTEDDTDDDDHSIKSGDKKRRRKMIIAKYDLLLSFVYFDTTHCGYIYEKDIEDLFYIMGLNLSRNQVRKLLSKVISRDALYYRKLTDKPKDENDTISVVTRHTGLIVPPEIISQLAKGNKVLLPKFSNENLQGNELSQKEKRKLPNDEDSKVSSTVKSKKDMVFYNGALVDVEELIKQIKRSDKAREDIEQLLTDLRRETSDLHTSNTKANNKIKDLQLEAKSLHRKLTDAEINISSLNRKCSEYYSILSSIYDRVSPLFRSSKSDRDREKDRDRDKDRGITDNDKSKDKDKEKHGKGRNDSYENGGDRDREKGGDKEKEQQRSYEKDKRRKEDEKKRHNEFDPDDKKDKNIVQNENESNSEILIKNNTV